MMRVVVRKTVLSGDYMGTIEKIDWDKLDGELYSVIAHASAGTDFCSPDLQMSVDGCIEETKRALKAAEENGSSHNSESAPCQHEWVYGMFHNICAKCGLVDDA